MAFYEQLSEIISTTLNQNDISAVKAEVIASATIGLVIKAFGGKTLYLPSMTSRKLTNKHSQIQTDFADGMSRDDLMTKYTIGEAWLRKIIKRGAVDEKLIF
jgi:Mor family transcriptional regulator